MHFFQILTLLPLALSASLLTKRDAQTLYDDITGIDRAVRKLTAILNAYNGGIVQSEPVFDASIGIHAVNQSKRIVNHVNETVGKSIPASVKVLEAKKPLFDHAQVSSVIEATILLLKNDHETFSMAVGEKLSADQAASGIAAAGKIDAVLQEASVYYAT